MVRINGGGGGGNEVLSKPSAPNPKVKLLCSYGGMIKPRLHDKRLTYIGGDTKLLAVDREIKVRDVVAKLSSLFSFNSEHVCIKYQLPGEDLDVLISLIDDDDFKNMIVEYDRLEKKISPNKTARLRLFIGTAKNPVKPDVGSDAPLNPDYLFGFDKEYDYSSPNNRPNSSKPPVDLSSWTIPTMDTVEPGNPNSGNDNSNGLLGGGCAKANQVVYQIPLLVTAPGFQLRHQYALQAVVPMAVFNGSQQRPVYNAVPPVPDQMKIAVSTVDMVSRRSNV